MSEFIHKAKIVALQQSNSELINEISNLKTKLNDLNGEIERPSGKNSDDINHLREKVTEYEQREAEFNERILSISKEAKNNKKKAVPKIIIAFLLGVLASLVAWHIANYLENDKFYSTIIKRVIDNILQLLT